MPDSDRTRTDDPDDEIEELLAECLERIELEGFDAIESVIAAHPEHADTLRRELRLLENAGMLEAQTPAGDRSLEEFEVIRPIGRGGAGQVYEAVQTSLQRRVALKVIDGVDLLPEDERKRLWREGRSLASIDHDHVVSVYSVGRAGDAFYLAMELLDGEGLDHVIETTTLPVEEVLRIGIEIAGALDAVHRTGLIHRDVKPANIRITASGRAVLLDFGLARRADDGTLTVSGEFRGTPSYAAPEQVDPEVGPMGPGVDVYALGATLYACLTGEPPFPTETTERAFRAVLYKEPVSLARLRPEVPRDFVTVLHKCLEKSPIDRYWDAEELVGELRALRDYRPIAARRPGVVGRMRRWVRRRRGAAAAGVIAVLAVIGAIVAVLVLERSRRLEIAERLGDAITGAERALADYRNARDRADAERPEVERWRELAGHRFLSDAEVGRRRQSEATLRTAEHEARLAFRAVFESAAIADRLEPDAGAGVRAAAYVERWREAARRASPDAERLAELARAHDAAGDYSAELEGLGRVVFAVEPTPEEVFVFRYEPHRDVGGDTARLVPRPLRLEAAVIPAGAHCLRVVREAQGLAAGALLSSVGGLGIEHWARVLEAGAALEPGSALATIDRQPIDSRFTLQQLGAPREDGELRQFEFLRPNGEIVDRRARSLADLGLRVGSVIELAAQGGIEATALVAGELRSLDLAPGLELRVTAAPLELSAASRIELRDRAVFLRYGDYIAVLRHDAGPDFRLPFRLGPGDDLTLRGRFDPREGPAGFERVVDPATGEHFWLQDREVTVAEYLEFLADPAMRLAIHFRPAIGPRTEDGESFDYFAGDGPTPAHNVSWIGASSFAAWCQRTRPVEGLQYALPTEHQWELAARAPGNRRYPWGDEFRAHWLKSFHSRTPIDYEPSYSYPIDESPYGIFDLGGARAEWCDGWFREEQRLRVLRGGSAGGETAAELSLERRRPAPDYGATVVYGFRLALVEPR